MSRQTCGEVQAVAYAQHGISAISISEYEGHLRVYVGINRAATNSIVALEKVYMDNNMQQACQELILVGR